MKRALIVSALVAAAYLAAGVSTAKANVSLKNGNFFLGYTDVVSPGGLEMKVERVYNSKTDYSGIFGAGWGCEFEVHLDVQDDGSVAVHEHGGGALNVFMPMNSKPTPMTVVYGRLMAAGDHSGRFGSDREREQFQRGLIGSHEDTWLQFRNLSLVTDPYVAVGETFQSGRFGNQVLTRVPEGYQRETDSGRMEAYDLHGRLQRVWDANHNFIAYRYDASGRLSEMHDNFGNRLRFAMDKKGHVAKITDARGRTATFKYDDKDNLVWSRDVDGNVYAYQYDRRHNLTAVRYDDHTSMEIAYTTVEEHENVKRVKERDGTATEYAYTLLADCDNWTAPSGRPVSCFSIDVVTRNARGDEQARSQYKYFTTYDAAHNEHEERLVTVNDGEKTDTVYNADGNPLSITTDSGTTRFTYDTHGHVTLKQTPAETTKLEYDPVVNKVTMVAHTRGAKTERSRFSYDAQGNLVHAMDDRGHDIALTYDAVGRIASMADAGGMTVRFTYNAQSKPVVLAVDGVGQINVTYKPDGEIEKVDSSAGRAIAVKVTSAFQVLLDVIRPAGVSLGF